jgi:CRP/FNR family transcriptional regulator, cyclic AMP receptor protein
MLAAPGRRRDPIESATPPRKGWRVDRFSVLKHVPLFAELADAELEVVTAAARRKRYPRGSIVFHEGDRGDCLCVILSGRVKVSLVGAHGRETIVRVLERLDFLGEMALIDEAPRSATVMAIEAVEVMEIARAPFLTLMQQQPAIALKVMGQLARALRRADEQIRTLSMFDVHGRVLRSLLLMAADRGEASRARMLLRPRPSVAELARMVGCTRETVSRAMKTLRSTGYISDVERGLAVEQRAIRQFFVPSLQNLAPVVDQIDRHAS